MERAKPTAKTPPSLAGDARATATVLYDRSSRGTQLRGLAEIVAGGPRLAAQRQAFAALRPLAARTSGPVQLENARQKAGRRRREVEAEWTTLDQDAQNLRTARVIPVAAAFTYGAAVPAGIQALWRRFPDIEPRIDDVGGDIHLLRTGVGRKTTANHANLVDAGGLSAERAQEHRDEMALLRAELDGYRARINALEQDANAWLVIAANLQQAFTDALQVHADTRGTVAALGGASATALGPKKPAAKIREAMAVLDGQWQGIAEMILVRKPDQAAILGRLTNWRDKHYEVVGLRSKDMMELNADAGAVATQVVGVLAAGDKIRVTPLEAVYRAEPFDNAADRFSISWGLEFGNATPKERLNLTWLTSWELHAHCVLTRAGGAGTPITGYTMTAGAAHVKPTVKQRALGVSIDVPPAFMATVQGATQAEFLGWVAGNATQIAGPKIANWAAK